MNAEHIQAKDLLKTSGILMGAPDDTLAETLEKLTRTHDAVFIFDEHKKFLGIINPYYTIFKSNYPGTTKVQNCLFHPPILSLATYIWDIAKLMVESKIYFLPVFDNSTFAGIVSINRILRTIKTDPKLLRQLQLVLKKPMITIQQHATLTEAYTLMRDKQVSRLPVVNMHEHLVGIVSRYDIQRAIAEPKEKPRFLSRVGEKEKFLEQSLDGYFRKVVVTATPDETIASILDKIITNTIGSIVVIDKNRKAVGIVSNHDILRALNALRPKHEPKLDLHVAKEFTEQTQLEQMIGQFISKVNKFTPVQQIRVVLEALKNPVGKVRKYSINLQLMIKGDGRKVIAKVTEYDWKQATHEAIDKVRKQLQR
ncbi:CBS domain-containing protein [Candidatus Roizmanbacteria bacterium]|nr:CBS domain-containing protein [Candidatus Roizmanbacteria bacterium]